MLSPHQRAGALVERPKRLIGRGGGQRLVIVPGRLAFDGFLTSQGTPDAACVRPARMRLARNNRRRSTFSSFGDRRGTVGFACPRPWRPRLQVMQRRANTRRPAPWSAARRPPSATAAWRTPASGRSCPNRNYPSARSPARSPDRANGCRSGTAAVPASPQLDAELLRLLDRVDRIGAGIGQARAPLPRSPAPAAETTRNPWYRGTDKRTLPSTLPPGALHEVRGVALQRLAERVIGGEEEPTVAAGFDHRAAGRLRQHVGVVDPMDRVGVHCAPVRSEVAAPELM